jgi:hypothetical protein
MWIYVSEELITFIFMVENQTIKKPACSRVLILSSETSVHIGLHGAVSQELAAFVISVLSSRENREPRFLTSFVYGILMRKQIMRWKYQMRQKSILIKYLWMVDIDLRQDSSNGLRQVCLSAVPHFPRRFLPLFLASSRQYAYICQDL